MVKFIILFCVACADSVRMWVTQVCYRRVSGRFLLLGMLTVRGWHRCREFHDLDVVYFFEPLAAVYVTCGYYEEIVFENCTFNVRKTT